MLNLSGMLEMQSVNNIQTMVETRFSNYSIFRTPESLILYEQGYLNNEQLLQLCNEQYTDEGIVLTEPNNSYIPVDIKTLFKDTDAVPIQYSISTRTIKAVYIPEYSYIELSEPNYNIEYIPTTLHYFITLYTKMYGRFREMLSIPGKDALSMIIEEAIRRGAPDLTISNEEESVIVYYNIKKKKVMSNHLFPREVMTDIIATLTITDPIADITDNKAKYVGYEIDNDYRARVVINKNFYGHVITLRIFSNAAFNTTMEDLNLNEELISLLRSKEFLSTNGITFIVGETMSGKNTTALSILNEVVSAGNKKVVSIEMPVEQRIMGVEQIGVSTVEEYKNNIESLIHQNPDFVYITETKDETGELVLRIANTGKVLLSTLHSNSVHDTLSRIEDVTRLGVNKIVQVLHCIIHQNLVNIDGEIYPENTYVVFTEELKEELYDKPFGEVIKIIKDKERGGFKDGLLLRNK